MTTAVKAPAVVGFVENVTVSEVVVADVTVPTAPLSKTTVLFAAIGSKLVPVIVTVVVVAAMFVIVDATVGDTLAMAVAALLKLKWTPVFGPAGAIAKVDRAWSGAAVMDFPRSAVVQGLMRAFVAIEFEVINQSFMTIGS